jgi:small subunit ribosomal protein S20
LTGVGVRGTGSGFTEEAQLANRHKSAIKRNRQNATRQERNRVVRSRVKTDVRKVREAVERQDLSAAETELRAAAKELNKAASKGVLHRNAAARRIARLSKRVATLKHAAG